MLSADSFIRMIRACADGATSEARAAADRALTEDSILRVDPSEWITGTAHPAFPPGFLDVTPETLRARPHNGGPERAVMHGYYVIPPDTLCGGSPRTTPRGPFPPDTTRRRYVWGGYPLEDGTYCLNSFDEPAGAFVIAAGSYTVEFSGRVIAPWPGAGEEVSLALAIDGVPFATHTNARTDPRHSFPIEFETSDSLTLASPGTLTLANASGFSQLVYGMLRVIPS